MRWLVLRITTARAEDPADSFLMPLRISSAEIRLLMRQVLGHALSGRTLNCPARSTGSRLKRGHPPTTPRVHKGDMSDLIDLTNRGIGVFSGYRLQSVHHVQVPFGLTPRQYLKWEAKLLAAEAILDVTSRFTMFSEGTEITAAAGQAPLNLVSKNIGLIPVSVA